MKQAPGELLPKGQNGRSKPGNVPTKGQNAAILRRSNAPGRAQAAVTAGHAPAQEQPGAANTPKGGANERQSADRARSVRRWEETPHKKRKGRRLRPFPLSYLSIPRGNAALIARTLFLIRFSGGGQPAGAVCLFDVCCTSCLVRNITK